MVWCKPVTPSLFSLQRNAFLVSANQEKMLPWCPWTSCPSLHACQVSSSLPSLTDRERGRNLSRWMIELPNHVRKWSQPIPLNLIVVPYEILNWVDVKYRSSMAVVGYVFFKILHVQYANNFFLPNRREKFVFGIVFHIDIRVLFFSFLTISRPLPEFLNLPVFLLIHYRFGDLFGFLILHPIMYWMNVLIQSMLLWLNHLLRHRQIRLLPSTQCPTLY